MKKYIAILTCCLMGLNLHAQSKWYLIGSGTIGSTRINQSGSTWPDQYLSNLTGFDAQAKVGYHLNNFRIEAGFQYRVTGYKQGLTFGSSFPDTMPTGYIKNNFAELSIPVSVGYQIALSPKFTLVPYLGFSAGYGLGLHYTTKVPDEKERSGKIDNDDFDAYYHKINFWGNTAIHLEYKISKRLDIIAGPSFQYMLTNMAKQTISIVPEGRNVQHNYMYGFDLGVKVNL